MAETGTKYGIHPNQITQWKKTFLKNLPEVFSKKKNDETEALKQRESELYRQIGQLKYEVDWLKKNLSSSVKSVSKLRDALETGEGKLSMRRQCEQPLRHLPQGQKERGRNASESVPDEAS